VLNQPHESYLINLSPTLSLSHFANQPPKKVLFSRVPHQKLCQKKFLLNLSKSPQFLKVMNILFYYYYCITITLLYSKSLQLYERQLIRTLYYVFLFNIFLKHFFVSVSL